MKTEGSLGCLREHTKDLLGYRVFSPLEVFSIPGIVIYWVLMLFVLGILFSAFGSINNALYNASVKQSGANSSASQSIKSTGQTIGLIENIVLFLEDPTDDLILAIVGVVIGLIAWFLKNSSWRGY